MRSFYLAFLLTHFFNLLLICRALTLPGIGSGVKRMFLPQFSHYGSVHAWYEILHLSVGFWFGANYGVPFVIGQHVKETTFAFPAVLLAGVTVFLLNVFNLFKVFGFMASLGQLTDAFFFNPFESMPVVLSVLPGTTFWLLVHFAFTLCSVLPSTTLVFEVTVGSLAELLPASWAIRDRFPRSLALPSLLGLLGFGGSVIALYVRPTGGIEYYIQSHQFLTFVYFIAVVFIVQAIAFLSLSKVATAGHEDLLAFVKRQSSASTMRAFKILVGVSLFVAGLLAYILVLVIPGTWTDGVSYGQNTPGFIYNGPLAIFILTLLALTLLVIWGTALVQSILFCINSQRHPCCSPLGKRLVDEEHVEKVEMM